MVDTRISALPLAGARPTSYVKVVARELALVLLATAFLALTARIRVELPFTPVPISGQTLGVLLVGALYGPRRGTLSLLTYLAEGALGLPVFAGGAAGLLVLFGPTGGYLVGFVPAAFVAGALATRHRPAWLRLAGMLAASATVYVFGVGWLMILGMPIERALAVGMLPFLVGDLLKSLLAAGVVPSGAALFECFGVKAR